MIENGEKLFASAEQWKKPLRIWHSKSDRITSAEASAHFANQAQNCEFTAFDEVQHELHHDRSRDDVYELMVEFILRER